MEHAKGYSDRGLHPHPQGRGNECVFSVRVQPRASRNRVLGMRDGALRVSVTAPPEGGKANSALLKLLAETLGIAKSQLRVVRGQSSQDKVVAVEGMRLEEVIRACSK